MFNWLLDFFVNWEETGPEPPREWRYTPTDTNNNILERWNEEEAKYELKLMDCSREEAQDFINFYNNNKEV